MCREMNAMLRSAGTLMAMPVLAAVLAGLAAQPAATAETATSKQYQTGIQVAQATAKTRGGDGGQGVVFEPTMNGDRSI